MKYAPRGTRRARAWAQCAAQARSLNNELSVFVVKSPRRTAHDLWGLSASRRGGTCLTTRDIYGRLKMSWGRQHGLSRGALRGPAAIISRHLAGFTGPGYRPRGRESYEPVVADRTGLTDPCACTARCSSHRLIGWSGQQLLKKGYLMLQRLALSCVAALPRLCAVTVTKRRQDAQSSRRHQGRGHLEPRRQSR